MNDLLNPNQGGFRTGQSTTSTIADFTDDIFLNNSKCTLAMFIDFRKAFDTVDHNVLKLKAELLGIPGLTLKWSDSYLNGRRKCTMANGCCSTDLPLKCTTRLNFGSTSLLNIYKRHQRWYPYLEALLFADDTVVYTSADSIQYAYSRLQEDLLTFNSGQRGYTICRPI